MAYAASSPGFGVTSPAPSSSRKRHATGSPPDPSHFVGLPPDAKRRRPNLANGFSAMSISPRSRGASVGPDVFTPTTPGAPAAASRAAPMASSARLAAVAGSSYHDDLDDDSLEPTQPPLDGDVTVEELPHPHQRPAVPSPRMKRPRPWHRHSSFSSSTDPSEDDDYESDATFRLPARPTPPVQASSVEHPDAHVPHADDGPNIEWIDTPSKRKQAAAESERRSKRRREAAAAPMAVDTDALPPGRYGDGWYEPEKDRIVVTSLCSSPETSPPPPDMQHVPPVNADKQSDYSYEHNRHLSQPGVQGFTISPSLLTHILNAQRSQTVPGPYSVHPERGLVLYRPLGIPGADHVVKEWAPAGHLYPDPDGHRFEEVDDDEDLSCGPPIVGVPADGGYPFQDAPQQWGAPMDGMDCAMDDAPWTGGDEAMDVE